MRLLRLEWEDGSGHEEVPVPKIWACGRDPPGRSTSAHVARSSKFVCMGEHGICSRAHLLGSPAQRWARRAASTWNVTLEKGCPPYRPSLPLCSYTPTPRPRLSCPWTPDPCPRCTDDGVGGGRPRHALGCRRYGVEVVAVYQSPEGLRSCPSPSRQLGRVTPFGSTREWSLRLVPQQVWRRLRRWGGGGLKGEIPRGQRFAGSPLCLTRQQPRHLARTPRAHYLNHSAQFPPRLGLEPVAPGLRPSSWLAYRPQRLSPFCVGRSQS